MEKRGPLWLRRHRARGAFFLNGLAKVTGIAPVGGPDFAKQKIQAMLDEFLDNGSASELAPANTDDLIVSKASAPRS